VSAVGVLGWALPDYPIIDTLGLNDWVTARSSVPPLSMSFLPRPILEGALHGADVDRDGVWSRDELLTAFSAVPGGNREMAAPIVDLLLVIFGESSTRLVVAQRQNVFDFFANLRFMAHERQPPADHLTAFDPNVTVEGRNIVVRQRTASLTAEAVRAIETTWRERVRRSRSGH
jgi:hypothetical protein